MIVGDPGGSHNDRKCRDNKSSCDGRCSVLIVEFTMLVGYTMTPR